MIKKKQQFKSFLFGKLSEEDISLWISRHWVKFIAGIVIFIGLIFATQQLLNKRSVENKNDFLAAQRSFEAYQTGHIPSNEELINIAKILKQHPELHPKYDGILAQTFLSQSNGENLTEALAIAKIHLSRIEKNQPSPYLQFSEGTLLIAQGQIIEAYESSKQLDNYLVEQENENLYPFLRVANLLRIAVLSQQLNDPLNELIAWEKLHQISLDQENQMAVVFNEMDARLQEGQCGLKDYMKKRLVQLNQQG